MQDIALPLFVPADRPERFAKAAAAGADAVIVDLEDAVAPDRKEAARAALPEAFPQGPAMLRINALGTRWAEGDLALAASLPLTAVMLPKAETAQDIAAARRAGVPVIALVETAIGLHNIDEIASAADRLAFGSIDFAADLGLAHTHQALLFARAQIVLAARCAGKPAPLDGVTTAIRDDAAIIADCRHATDMGFCGKLLIHPAQISPARQGLRPSEADILWAERVLNAADGGASSIDGAMVDAPVIQRARQIWHRAERAGHGH